MTKIKVVAQAPYPVPVAHGRHLVPGEIATTERTPEVESLLVLGMIREIPESIEAPQPNPPAEKEQPRKPRASNAARNDDQEDL